jgi:hypothetical protein
LSFGLWLFYLFFESGFMNGTKDRNLFSAQQQKTNWGLKDE